MNNDDIKKVIEEFLTQLSVSFKDVRIIEDETINTSVTFMIDTEDSNILIGTRGETLNSLSHLIHRVVSNQINREEKQPFFIVDINEYQTRKLETLRRNATMMAERARTFKHDVEMEPQSSYERMIVHSLFADDPTINTESDGFGLARHIVIKFVDTNI
ncbi:hypothetical protein COB55_05050 [Candidatus Wolfebacteria bacterium]|nr:MAG: hypothetical protein COB55_05050 [Candidatus Wolfebacteria bacterium]